MIETINQIHPKSVCLIKIGTFYHAYGKDAYILSYLFNYKLKTVNKNIKECGFPVTSINKIMARLESIKINYLLIDQRNNFDVDEQMNFKQENNYEKYYEKAKLYSNYIVRIESINSFLMENMNKENFRKILSDIEEILYERREV